MTVKPAGVKGKPAQGAGCAATLDTGRLDSLVEDMNDPDVIMLDALPDNNLIAHRKALEAAAIAMSLVVRVPTPLKCLADQVTRSASSVPANLAEGHGRSGRDNEMHLVSSWALGRKKAWLVSQPRHLPVEEE